MGHEGTTVTYVEDDKGNEREIELTFSCSPEEPRSRWSPGYPAEQELTAAVYTDTGESVPDEVLETLDLCDLGGEADTNAREADEAAREDAYEARREHMRELREERD